MNEWLKLLGVAIVIIGFALRLRTTIVVVAAGIVTGLLAGLPLFTAQNGEGIVNMLGRAFVENRLMTLFIITLPAVGLAERYGLQAEARRLITRIAGATVGRLPFVYQLFRVLCGILGLRLNGHPTFVRPLLFPMLTGATQAAFAKTDENAQGVAQLDESTTERRSLIEERRRLKRTPDEAKSAADKQREAELDVAYEEQAARHRQTYGAAYKSEQEFFNDARVDKLKAASAAAENYGNFYGQNLNPAQAGILLVFGVMQGLGYTVGVWHLVLYAVPIVLCSLALAAIQFALFGKKLFKKS